MSKRQQPQEAIRRDWQTGTPGGQRPGARRPGAGSPSSKPPGPHSLEHEQPGQQQQAQMNRHIGRQGSEGTQGSQGLRGAKMARETSSQRKNARPKRGR